jgi:hypothetical protein
MLASTQSTELRILALPFGDPGHPIPVGFPQIAPVVDPAQLLQAIVIGFAWQVVERVPQEMHVAALPGRFGKHFADGLLQTGMIVGNDELDARQTTLFEPQQKVLPTALALAVGCFHG